VNALEGYQLVQRIGMGTGGAVYQAKTDTGEVAIRQFESKSEPASQAWLDERQSFLQAGRQSLGLTHPRIVPVLEVIDQTGEAFIVMEYVAAPTLATALLSTRRFTPAETDTILSQVATALDFAHGRGVVHGDLKPSDIFLTEKGAKVSDFGISPRARRFDRRPVAASLVHGYLSPEHLRGSASLGPRSDQYSLAVIAYQMYTGQSPYGESVLKLPSAILSTPITPPSEVDRQLPSSIDAPLLRALNRDPEQRFGSCVEFVAFLGASFITQQEAPRRRVSKFVYLLAAVLLLLFLAGIWFWPRIPPLPKVHLASAKPPPPIFSPLNPTIRTFGSVVRKGAGPILQPPLVPPPVAPHFTIDVLSRDNPIEEGKSFSSDDPKFGELGKFDLGALISFEGQHLKRDRLELKWIIDDLVMQRETVIFQPEPGAKQTIMTKYGNEPTPGNYRITLEQKDHILKSFTFQITK
jgi:serine/threonine protein kinase